MALKNKQELWKGAVNCDVYWCKHNNADQHGKYLYDLANLSGPCVAKLSELGVKILQKGPEVGNYATSKSNYPIKVVNEVGDDMSTASIGNGSKATGAIRIISGDNSFGPQIFVETQKLQINELEIYEAGESSEEISMEDAL